VDDGRWNLPLITVVIAVATLLIISALQLKAAKGVAAAGTLAITLIFISRAIFGGITVWVSDATFSPLAQYHARNQALFIGSTLGVAAVLALRERIPWSIWLRPPTFIVVVALALAQFSWDLAARERWRTYLADVRARLAASDGLISWDRL